MTPRVRALLRAALQVVFLIGVAVAITLAWIDQGDAIIAALVPASPLGAGLIVLGSLLAMLPLVPHWRALAGFLGTRVPWPSAVRIVVAGQLGKYLPGGVWTIGAQGYTAHGAAVPWRLGVAVGLLQIGTLIVAGGVIGGVGILAGVTPWNPLWGAPLIVVAVIGGMPVIVRRIGVSLLRPDEQPARGPALPVVGWSFAYWGGTTLAAVGAGLALAPDAIGTILVASTLGYAAGALVIIAPAGIGVREAVVVATLAPAVGFATAAAIALLLRLGAVIGDLAGCGALTVFARPTR